MTVVSIFKLVGTDEGRVGQPLSNHFLQVVFIVVALGHLTKVSLQATAVLKHMTPFLLLSQGV